jgi:hypothetical protein
MIFKSVPRTLPPSTRRRAGVAERSASPLGVPRFLRGNTSDARPAHAAVTMATRLAAHEMVSHRPVALSSQPLQIARQTVAKTSGEVVEWWPARQDPQWNPQYEERYRRTRAQGRHRPERLRCRAGVGQGQGGQQPRRHEGEHPGSALTRCAGSSWLAAKRPLPSAAPRWPETSVRRSRPCSSTLRRPRPTTWPTWRARAEASSKRVGGEKRSYAPFQGRGPIQVTHPENYARALGTLQQRRDQIEAQIETQATDIAILMSERDNATDATQKQEVIARIDAAHAAVDVFRLQMIATRRYHRRGQCRSEGGGRPEARVLDVRRVDAQDRGHDRHGKTRRQRAFRRQRPGRHLGFRVATRA